MATITEIKGGLPGLARKTVATVIVATLYWGLWHASTVFEYAPHVSLWFAPSGLVVAVLLLWKRDGWIKAWISVFSLSVFAQITQYSTPSIGDAITVSVAIATSGTLPYWLAVKFFVRTDLASDGGVTGALLRPIWYSVLTLAAALGAAVLGILSLVTLSNLSTSEAETIWLAWWIGDFVGVTILAPLFVMIGTHLFEQWVEPHDTFLVDKGRGKEEFALGTLGWLSFALVILLPPMVAIARSEIDERIPTILAFMLALLPIAILAARASWLVIVTVVVLSSLSTIFAVKYFGVVGDGIVYQTTLLAIVITAHYFHTFVAVAQSQSLRIERSTEEQNELKDRVMHDPLTNAFNRQAIEEQFAEVLKRCRRDHEQIGIIMLDIDRFKSVNDMHGHAVGDEVLITFVKIINASTRTNDTCLRWGGEEFLILSAVSSLEALAMLAENVRAQVESTKFSDTPSITCSAGAAVLQEGESLKQVLHRADEALYEAKKNGRNQVCTAQIKGESAHSI